MAKKITGFIKLQIPAGQATPAPPVGPALGQQGVNIMEFCKTFNARTQGQQGLIIPVVITVYSDRSFTFVTKTPPAAVLLLRAAGLQKGSGVPNKDKVGKVTKKQVEEIAKTKMPDLNAASLEAAIKTVEGTARRPDSGHAVGCGRPRLLFQPRRQGDHCRGAARIQSHRTGRSGGDRRRLTGRCGRRSVHPHQGTRVSNRD